MLRESPRRDEVTAVELQELGTSARPRRRSGRRAGTDGSRPLGGECRCIARYETADAACAAERGAEQRGGGVAERHASCDHRSVGEHRLRRAGRAAGRAEGDGDGRGGPATAAGVQRRPGVGRRRRGRRRPRPGVLRGRRRAGAPGLGVQSGARRAPDVAGRTCWARSARSRPRSARACEPLSTPPRGTVALVDLPVAERGRAASTSARSPSLDTFPGHPEAIR